MAELVRLAEKIIVVVGVIYLTGSLDHVLPDAVGSLTQYGVYFLSFLLLLARWRRTVSTAMRNPFLWILLTITLLSFLWSMFPNDSLRSAIVAFQTAFFSLYVASCYSLKEQLRLIGLALGIVMVFTLFYTLAFPSQAIHTGEHQGAWRGIFIHKNILAEICTYSATIFLFLRLTMRRFNSLAWGGLLLSITLLVLADSKTALMVFLTLFILLQFYKGLRWENHRSIIILNITIFLFAGISVLLVSNAATILQSMGRDLTLTGRTEIWDGAIARIEQRPWLGYGRDAFWHPQSNFPAAIGEEIGANYVPPDAHNGFINLACDLGMIGLSFFILSYLLAFVRAYHRVRLTRSPEHLWPLVYLSFLLLYNLTESSILSHNSILWATYMMTALSLGPIPITSPMGDLEPPAPSKPALIPEGLTDYSQI